jgi:carboxymethylenebutenolidase
MNPHDPAEVSTLFKVLFRITGSGYDDAATQDARRRIVDSFDVRLKANLTTSGGPS